MFPTAFPQLRHLALAAALAGLTAAPAHAQLFGGDDEARQAILKLRQELSEVRSEGQRGRLHLATQVEELQRQVEVMRGQIETLSKQMSDSLQAQRNLSQDFNEQQQRGLPGSPDAASLLGASGEEQAAYDGAIDLFRNGSYKDSAQALGQFVQRYPRSVYASTAQFYWGSSLYALKDYKSAIVQLQTMIKNWPDSPRAPDAYLVIAGSQIELNDLNGARATLQRITSQYPNSQAAATARDRLSLLR